MPKKGSMGGRAGIFRPWDGKLTGPAPGEPSPMPDRNQSWGSVKKKQEPKTFTAEEVKEIVAEAIAAIKTGNEIPDLDNVLEEKKELRQEEFVVGGK